MEWGILTYGPSKSHYPLDKSLSKQIYSIGFASSFYPLDTDLPAGIQHLSKWITSRFWRNSFTKQWFTRIDGQIANLFTFEQLRPGQ